MDKLVSFQKIYYEWWKNIDKFILTLIILLFLIGLFFSLVSTSLIASDKLNTNDYLFFFKHLIFLCIGAFFIFTFSSMGQENLFKISIFLFVLSIVLLLLVPLIGIEVKGSKRWIDLYLLPRFQPIELVKPFLIVFLSIILSSERYVNVHLKYLVSFLVTLRCILTSFTTRYWSNSINFLFMVSVIFISGISFIFLISLFLFYFIIHLLNFIYP